MRLLLNFSLTVFCFYVFPAQVSQENKGLSQKAEILLFSDIKQAKKIGNLLLDNALSTDEKSAAYLLLAEINLYSNNYNDFGSNINNAFLHAEKGGKSKYILSKIHLTYAKEYSDLGIYSQSERHISIAKNIFTRINNPKERLELDIFLKEIEINNQIKKTNSVDESLLISLDSLERSKAGSVSENIHLGMIYYNLTKYYFNKKDNTSFKKYFYDLREIITLQPSLKYYDLNANVYFHILNQKYPLALKVLKEMQPIDKNILSPELKNDVVGNFYSTYFALVQFDKCEIYDTRHRSLSDSINYVKNKASFQLIEGLPHQNDIVFSNQNRNYNIIILSLSGFIFLIIVIGSLILINLKSNYNKYQHIIKRIEENPLYKNINNKATTLAEEELPVGDDKPENVGLDYKGNVLSEKTELFILKKLEKFEQSHKFTNSNMSLQGLSKIIDTNTKYLSLIINKHKSSSFNQYINELRVNYIISKLKNEPKYRKYKISYLAEESGFSSPSSFATIFKSIAGLSPTTFISYLNKEDND